MSDRFAPAPIRFWRKVARSEGCWDWRGFVSKSGYGQFWDGHRHVYAHRFAFELMVRDLAEGEVIDHLCRNRSCVNPAHLEATDMRTNALRGEGITAQYAARTHCKHGHPYDRENTRRLANGSRVCRACQRARRAKGVVKK